jgi:hypothetical protein
MEHSNVKLSGEVLLANFNLSDDRMGLDVGAMIVFIVVALGTFLCFVTLVYVFSYMVMGAILNLGSLPRSC